MKKIKLNISTDLKKVPNKFHFNIQLRTKANVYKDKTKYTRKEKHKNGKLY